jgi:PKD repeat protein
MHSQQTAIQKPERLVHPGQAFKPIFHGLLLALLPLTTAAQNIYDARQSVMLEATVQDNPPSITLHWVSDATNGGYTIWRKAKSDTQWGDSLAVVGPAATSWTDTSAAIGIGYEYQVLKSLPDFPYGNGTPNFGAGYLYTGIQLPPTHHRGECLVVIDSTFKQTLAPEIAQLLADIQADGWQTRALYIDRNDPVPTVKAQIKTWAQTHPADNQTLLLFGRVPVPYAGLIAPDGHDDHRGAWPCDGFYANLDGVWTDQTVNVNLPGTRNDNVPGDGKFDNSTFPTPIKLQVGRVDFSNMNRFQESEEQLLRRYLNKDHAWRTGRMPMQERALVDNNFPALLDGFGEAGWKNFTPMFGFSNVKDLPYRQTLSNQSYMWSYGCGGGGPESASDISSTTNFTTDSLQTAFTMIFGSYFGDWDYPNNFLRGAIASRTCLASTWGNRPVWFLHHMALGEHIGYSALVTMTNLGNYTPRYYGAFVHSALMGDPTLRMHMFRPVENLQASQAGLHVQLDWLDPAGAQGYFVYKKTPADTAYQLLNQEPLAATTFLDSCAGPGSISYMVRSVELRSSASGTYFNLSTGVYAAIQSDPGPFSAAADFSPMVYFDALTTQNTSLNGQFYHWDLGDGDTSTAMQPNHLYSQPGNYTVCLVASDACTADTACLPVTILSSLPQVSATIADAVCFGTSTGIVALSTSGGTPILYFSWSGSPDADATAGQLSAGDYTCTITSETGHSAVYGPYTVGEPAALLLDPVVIPASSGQSDGSVSVTVQGGCPPYGYTWNTGQNSAGIQGLEPGVYCVTVTDCRDCSEVYCATVEQASSVSALPALRSYRLYPNPVQDHLVLELYFDAHQSLELDIIDAQGRRVAHQSGVGTNIRLRWDVRFLAAGVYRLRVMSSEGSVWLPFMVGG